MKTPTTRRTAPAAAPRTGRGAIALPGDPGLDRLLADPALSPTAKLIAIALVKNWAWSKDHCWPADRTIADRIGRSAGHVQRCLRELEAAGWIIRERTGEVRSGRRIWLTWRCSASSSAQAGSAPAREASAAPARSERIVVVKGEIEREEEAAIPERLRSEPTPPAPLPAATLPEQPVVLAPIEAIPPPPAPRAEPIAAPVARVPLTPGQQARLAELPPAAREQVLTWLMLDDPILAAEARRRLSAPAARPESPRTLPELLGRIREDPAFPGMAAAGLARAFDDQRSYSGFLARCTEAWHGKLPVERLVAAYAQATGPQAKRPGALFMHALRANAGGT